MVRRGKHVVFRAQNIPIGYDGKVAYQSALKELSSSVSTDFFANDNFLSRESDDQAEEVLRVAIQLEVARNGDAAPYGEMGAQILPMCSTDCKDRAALVYFQGDNIPQFLGGNKQGAINSNEHTVEIGQSQLIFSVSFQGMTQLYTPTAGAIRADIIAVPGIDGHAFGSWTAKDSAGKMWLADFFSKDYSDCRTFIYGYESKLRDRNESTLGDYGKDFLNQIQEIRSSEEEKERPLYLFGHSFGGLLIENALCEDSISEGSNRVILHAVRGIIFFGVPHRGLDTEDMSQLVEKASPRHKLLAEIKLRSQSLANQLDRFKNIAIEHDFRIVCFYERKQIRAIEMTAASSGKASLGRTSQSQYLAVEKNSAIIGLSRQIEKYILSNGDHSDMVKFSHNQNKTYKEVHAHMRGWMKIHRDQGLQGDSLHGGHSGGAQPNTQTTKRIPSASGNRQTLTAVDRKPRMSFRQLSLWVNQMVKFCQAIFQKTSLLYLHRNSIQFDDPISKMRGEYGELGTCRWILNATEFPDYATWDKEREPQVILIESSPGDGKSCLVSFLSEQQDMDQKVTLHFFSTPALKAITEDKLRSTSGTNTYARRSATINTRSEIKDPPPGTTGQSMGATHKAASKSQQSSQSTKKEPSASRTNSQARNAARDKVENTGSVEEAIILRTLLWQLTQKLAGGKKAEIWRKIVEKRRKLKASPQGARELFDSSGEMWEIMTTAPGVSELRIIIDDVHLCDKSFIEKLVGALEKRDSSVTVKAILTAPNGSFKLELTTSNSYMSLKLKVLHLMNLGGVQEDIMKYIKKGLEGMREEFELDQEFTDLLEKKMLEKQGPWLWAKASLDRLNRTFNAWKIHQIERPWKFTTDIVPADSLNGAFKSLLEEVSTVGLQIIKWDVLTYNIDRKMDPKMVVRLQEQDFKQMFHYSEQMSGVNSEELVVQDVVRPAAFVDPDDHCIKAFHPSLMDYVRENLITEDDRRDLAVICLKYLCTSSDYTDASKRLLDSGFIAGKSPSNLKAPDIEKVLGLNEKNTRSRLLTHIMLYWPDHISILGEKSSNSSFEHLQTFYAPGNGHFERWLNYYQVASMNESDPWIYANAAGRIQGAEKISLLHIVAERGTLNLFKRCLPMTPQKRRTPRSATDPHIPFRWHTSRVLNPESPVIDYQDSLKRSILIHAMLNSSTSDIAIYLISQGVDVDAPDDHNLSPLSWASIGKNNQYEIARSLLQRGVKEPDWPDNDGDTPLMNALYEDAPVEVVALLCSIGRANVNHQNKMGGTPLWVAAYKNNLAAGKILLQCKNIHINSTDNSRKSALITAAGMGHNDFLELLLAQPEIDVNQFQMSSGWQGMPNCLGSAAESGHVSTVELLLKDYRVKVTPTPAMVKDHDALCALALAAENGHKEVISVLLSDPRTETNCKGWNDTTPLMAAASYDSVPIINMLLSDRDVDINAKNGWGSSALSLAVSYGHPEIAQALVDSNAIANPQDLFMAALYCANGDKNPGILTWVLDHYMNEINTRFTDYDGETALMFAARMGNTAFVDILLNRCKLHPDYTDDMGKTALMKAATYGYDKFVRALMKDTRLKNLDARDEDGSTALSYAAANGYPDVVNLLLGLKHDKKDDKDKNGMEPPPSISMCPNTTGPKGATAVIEAAKRGHTDVIEILHLYGADFNRVDDDGRNALMHAAANGHEAAVVMLLKWRPAETESKPRDSSNDKQDGRSMEKILTDEAHELGETAAVVSDSRNQPETAPNLKTVDPNHADVKGCTALTEAAKGGHDKIIEVFLSDGRVDVSHQDKDGRTAFYYAAENAYPVATKLLLDGELTSSVPAPLYSSSIQVNSGPTKSNDYDYPYTIKIILDGERSWFLHRIYSDFRKLHRSLVVKFGKEAGKTGRPRIIPYMPEPVESNLTENAKNARKDSLNDYIQGLLELPNKISKSLLVKNFFYPRPGDFETTPDQQDMLVAIIQRRPGPGGRTPLIEASRKGHVEVVDILLGTVHSGWNHYDDEGRTALSYAIEVGSLAVVIALLKAGKADLEYKDKNGKVLEDYIDGSHIYADKIRIILSQNTLWQEEMERIDKELNPHQEDREDEEDEVKEDDTPAEEAPEVFKTFAQVAVLGWRWARLRMMVKKKIDKRDNTEEELEKDQPEHTGFKFFADVGMLVWRVAQLSRILAKKVERRKEREKNKKEKNHAGDGTDENSRDEDESTAVQKKGEYLDENGKDKSDGDTIDKEESVKEDGVKEDGAKGDGVKEDALKVDCLEVYKGKADETEKEEDGGQDSGNIQDKKDAQGKGDDRKSAINPDEDRDRKDRTFTSEQPVSSLDDEAGAVKLHSSIDLPTPPGDIVTPRSSTPKCCPGTPDADLNTSESKSGTSSPPSLTSPSLSMSAPSSPEQVRQCRSCETRFDSRTKLLIHLREAGHQQFEETPEDDAGVNDRFVSAVET